MVESEDGIGKIGRVRTIVVDSGLHKVGEVKPLIGGVGLG